MNDEYFDSAYKELMRVAKAQEKHWEELPAILDRHAANTAVRVSAATKDAISAGLAEVQERLGKIDDRLIEQHTTLSQLDETVRKLVRKVARHDTVVKDLRRDLMALTQRVADLEAARRAQ